MKIGKVSQTVLKRSLLKPLQFKRKDALVQPSVEEMCYGIRTGESQQTLAASVVLYGNEKDLGVFALAQVSNDLATRGAEPLGVSVHIMLPPYAYESRLKAMIELIEQSASERGIQVLSAKAEVSPAVSKAVVSLTGIGRLEPDALMQSKNGKAGQDIVLLKWIGLEGTFRILREKEEELRQRFVPTFLNQIHALEPQMFSVDALKLARELGVSAMHQITSGGVLAALWEFSEASNVGIEVDLKKMTIRQETIEVCEFCHMNPYQLTSAGSVLIFTEDGETLVEAYTKQGIQAAVIGKTTADTARVLIGGEEKRFLERPAADELLKLYDLN